MMPVAELFPILQKFPIFANLTAQQLNWVASRMHVHTFNAGSEMIVFGTPGERVYIILNGMVKVYAPQLDGSEVIINLLGPGAPVGEMSVLDRASRSASVLTIEDTMVGWMSSDDFRQALLTIPHLAMNLLYLLSARIRLSNTHMQALASLDVNGRIARQLLAFAELYGQPAPEGTLIPLRLPQSEIAELVGASRKRVNQVMGEFKRAGFINFDNDLRVTILDSDALGNCCVL